MKYIRNVPILLALSWLIMGLVLLINFRTLPPEIPLFYSSANTSTQVVPFIYVGILPIVSIVSVLVNFILAKQFFNHHALAKHIIDTANIVIICITTYIFVRIILLVS